MANLQKAVQIRVLRFHGALDAYQAPVIRQAFHQVASAQTVIVDLEKVIFIDSVGLGALLGGIRRIRDLGGAIAMCSPSRSVNKVFKMTGVDRLAPVADTHEQAAAALNLQTPRTTRPPP